MVEEMVKRANTRLNKAAATKITQDPVREGPMNKETVGADAQDVQNLSSTAGEENREGQRDRANREWEVMHESNSDDSFKEIPNPMKHSAQGQDIASKYKAILSVVPRIVEPGDQLHVTKSSTTNEGSAEIVESSAAVVRSSATNEGSEVIAPVTTSTLVAVKSDRELIWDKAMLALETGDKASADFYLRVYRKMEVNTSLSIPDKPDILRSTSSNAINPGVNVVKRLADKTTIVFVKGS
ncbi:hypothetical protein PTTG_12766, partial [Puccinia triticina 1-1 BBBD Race 1]